MATYSAPVTPDETWVVVTPRNGGGYYQRGVRWDEPLAVHDLPPDPDGQPVRQHTELNPVSNFLTVAQPTHGATALWEYMPRFYAGQNEADYPFSPPGMSPDRMRQMHDQALKGTGYNHGAVSDSGDGSAYPEGQWSFGKSFAGTIGHSSARQDYAKHKQFLEQRIHSTNASTISLTGLDQFIAADEDQTLTTNDYTEPWDAYAHLAPPSGNVGYEIVTPGHLVRGEIIIFSRVMNVDGFGNPVTDLYRTGDLTKDESPDRIVMGVAEHIDLLGPSVKVPDVLAATKVLNNVPVPRPTSNTDDWTVTSFPMPSVMPFAPTDGIVLFTTPGIMPALNAPDLADGWPEPEYALGDPEGVWPQQFTPQHVWPDNSTKTWQQYPAVYYGVQYRYQPPTIRWIFPGTTSFVPAPPARLSGRIDGLGPLGGAHRIDTTGPSRQSGFHPGGYL